MSVSPNYRENYEYEKGEELWTNLNKGLDPPEGNPKKDSSRLQQFADRVKKSLTKKEKRLLVNWLRQRLTALDNNYDEDSTPYVKNYESKQKIIYHLHIEAIN